MATMHLQQALKSLCSKNGWCYAVFWKLKRRSQMMLTWEEGYYDKSKKSDPCGGVSGTEGNPLDQRGHGDLEGQIALAVAKMSYCVFSMGEGIIGRVAFTGKHKWVFHNADVAPEGMLDNQSMLEKYPEGWQGQFAAGIKTIAVIAVTQGVVQLGSTKLIKEDSGWLDHIKSVFSTIQSTPSIVRSDVLSGGQGERLTHRGVSYPYDVVLTASNVVDHSIDSSRRIGTEVMSSTIQTDYLGIAASNFDAKENERFLGIAVSSGTCEQKKVEIQHKPFDTSSSNRCFITEKTMPITLQCNLGFNDLPKPMRASDEFASICENNANHIYSEFTDSDGGGLKSSKFSNQNNDGTHELETFLASFAREQSSNWSIGDELSQALGLTVKKGEIDDQAAPLKKTEINRENHLQNVYVKHYDITQKWPSSAINVELPENKSELLLDAVVANSSSSYQSASSSLADESFPAKTLYPSLSGGVPPLTTIKETEIKTTLPTSRLQDVAHEHTLYNDLDVVNISNGHPTLSFSNFSPKKGVIRGWASEVQSLKSDDTQRSYSRKSEDRGGKKRSRSGDGSRPRPKDRQQIQDRVRELRDIVPSAAKCSIDTLLEKTIKHMLFLQSVALHAEQLKINGELKEDIESGATWALDQETKNPILVKDLKQPRHMLVEMICEEKGVFLEIADIVRSLGLTILKGIMESHGDKVWAKFVVEASRDVQRVDVLLPLVQQLPLTNKSNIASMSIASQAVPK